MITQTLLKKSQENGAFFNVNLTSSVFSVSAHVHYITYFCLLLKIRLNA